MPDSVASKKPIVLDATADLAVDRTGRSLLRENVDVLDTKTGKSRAMQAVSDMSFSANGRRVQTCTASRVGVLLLVVCLSCGVGRAQGLSPRAYVITPVHANAVTLTYSFQQGDVVFNQGLPITDASGGISTGLLSCFHSLDFFGRSANLNVSLPYAVGRFEGNLAGTHQEIYRSGLAPLSLRFSVNLKGGPAMTPEEFAKRKQPRTVIGTSLTVELPTGQYDGARLINVGDNRWAFKPEIGLSRRWGRLVLDTYGGAWFFTANHDFFSGAPGSTGHNTQTQDPIGVIEMHLSYDVKPRLWVSLDGNFWRGGETSLNGIRATTTLQQNSRLGATASVPVSSHQSFKFSYSRGTYVRFGGDFQLVQVAWQYSWLGRPN